MILWRLVGLKYWVYLSCVSGLLGCLYTFVEVAEKLARYRDCTALAVLHYAVVAFIPSFILLLPISAWLSAVLLLRELSMRGHLVALAIYGVRPRRIVMIVGVCAGLAAMGAVLLHEAAGYRLAQRMASAKVWLFKQPAAPAHDWLRQGPTTFVLGAHGERSYIVEGGDRPTIRIVKHLAGSSQVESMYCSLVEAVIHQELGGCSVQAPLDVLTHAVAEESFVGAVRATQTLYGRQVVGDLSYFFLKILLLPVLAMAFFFLFTLKPIGRWIGVCLPHLILGVGYAAMAIFGPLLGLGLFLAAMLFLVGYLLVAIS
jgi:hypothetical protein